MVNVASIWKKNQKFQLSFWQKLTKPIFHGREKNETISKFPCAKMLRSARLKT